MVSVEMTPHLYRFFPQLEHQTISVAAGSVADILMQIETIAPGFRDYIIDEQGALRRHVRLSINGTVLVDRKTLSDRAADDDKVFIFQALSGG